MIDSIAAFLIRALNLFLHIMPIRFNLWLGSEIGSLVYFLNSKRAAIAYANLKAAFCKEETPEEIKRITKRVYKNIGETFAEILSMTKVDKNYINKYVVVHNMDRIERASRHHKGMILLSAHFGNWELSTVTSIMKGFQLYLLARDQKMMRVYELLNRLRESKGNIVIRKGADIKDIFRVLHNGKAVGILGDQNAGSNGVLINLFNRPASQATGPFRFAQATGALILPAFIYRIKGPYHHLMLEELMTIGKSDDIMPYMERYNALLEKHVKEYPEQWLWMHKKWKLTPLKKVLVLDDEKKGHLKQSLAIVKRILTFREAEGYKPDQVEVNIVQVRFKNKLAKVLFNAASPFFGSYCRGSLKLLRLTLNKMSYKDISKQYADIIISCGSALFGVNRILKIENNCRNLTIFDPGPLLRKKFNLILIPRHDMAHKNIKGDNIIVTDLAPNLIEPQPTHDPRPTTHDSRFTIHDPQIGILLGGDNPYFAFSDRLTESLANAILTASEEVNSSFYLTTSRRTPESAEEILKEKLSNSPRCVKFVSGKYDTDEKTVENILAASDIVIVSGESISMVSEAVSSGKRVLVFMPCKKVRAITKYERFIEGLKARGYIELVEVDQIPEAIERVIRQRREVKLPEDNKRIYEKIYKLF